jgi:hypothetical protein
MSTLVQCLFKKVIMFLGQTSIAGLELLLFHTLTLVCNNCLQDMLLPLLGVHRARLGR